MWRVALLLAGCNAIFSIKDTRQVDAAYFDAPPDAPFSCPAVGAAPPRFSRLLHQETIQTCASYSTNDVLASGSCTGSDGVSNLIMVGPPHAVLVPDPTLPQSQTMAAPVTYFENPFPSTDGTRIYVTHAHGELNFEYTIDIYQHDASGWTAAGTLPARTVNPLLQSVSRAPTGDRIVILDGADQVELVSDGSGGYTPVNDHPMSDLGLVYVSQISLSGDGLHAVVAGQVQGTNTTAMFWTDRASTEDWFVPVKPIIDLPALASFSLAEDCSRLYFPALGSIIYLQQD